MSNPLCDTLTCCMLSCEDFAKNNCGDLRPKGHAGNIVCPEGRCNTGMVLFATGKRCLVYIRSQRLSLWMLAASSDFVAPEMRGH